MSSPSPLEIRGDTARGGLCLFETAYSQLATYYPNGMDELNSPNAVFQANETEIFSVSPEKSERSFSTTAIHTVFPGNQVLPDTEVSQISNR